MLKLEIFNSETNEWIIEKHNIVQHSVSTELWDVLKKNPVVYMRCYCDREFIEKYKDNLLKYF